MTRANNPGPDLSVSIPRADRRARAYKLEDNGASDIALRKRNARDAIASAQRSIQRIRDRQNRIHPLPPMDQSDAGPLISRYNDIIRTNREVLEEAEASSALIAPMTRRVAREDRRRRRAAKRNKALQEKS